MLHRWTGSPIGDLLLVREGAALVAIHFPQEGKRAPAPAGSVCDDGAFDDVTGQLDAYFRGALRSFDLTLEPRGTPFQLEVWNALRKIPYGTTTSYAKLAASIGRPAAIRAVGAANGSNPIPIVIPCHRVIGANGSLTGFGGGLPAKRFLLDLETWV